MKIRFDLTEFMNDQFGTPEGLIAVAAKYDVFVPSKDTVRKWRERGRISGEWFGALCALAEMEAGRPVSLSPYVSFVDEGIFG